MAPPSWKILTSCLICTLNLKIMIQSAGHMIHELGHIPTEGEYIDINGIRFTVMKMDKHRVADIDIRLPEAETEQSPSEH